MFEHVFKNPAVKRALEAGEEQAGRLVARLFANGSVANGVSFLVSGALRARQTVEGGLKEVLRRTSLPTDEDVEALRTRLDELEAMIDRMAERTTAERRTPKGES